MAWGVDESGPAGHGRHDRDRVGCGELRVEAVLEAHVLVADEDVDEAAQLAAVVEQPVADAGVGSLEVGDDGAQVVPFDLDLGPTVGELGWASARDGRQRAIGPAANDALNASRAGEVR
jgi:hypothetical protein